LILACSVIVDFNVMVDLQWKIPNSSALKDNRISTPEVIARNISLAPGVHYKQVEQVNKMKQRETETDRNRKKDRNRLSRTRGSQPRRLRQEKSPLRQGSTISKWKR
jgi:hypothetical protein